MTSIAYRFFLLAVLSVTIGMVWGIQMSATHDHTLSPAHAHLNLIGWVTMGLFGLYYSVTPQAAASGLARVHFWLAAIGLVIIAPGIALAINEVTELAAIVGSFLTLGSMLTFLVVVIRNGIGAAH